VASKNTKKLLFADKGNKVSVAMINLSTVIIIFQLTSFLTFAISFFQQLSLVDNCNALVFSVKLLMTTLICRHHKMCLSDCQTLKARKHELALLIF